MKLLNKFNLTSFFIFTLTISYAWSNIGYLIIGDSAFILQHLNFSKYHPFIQPALFLIACFTGIFIFRQAGNRLQNLDKNITQFAGLIALVAGIFLTKVMLPYFPPNTLFHPLHTLEIRTNPLNDQPKGIVRLLAMTTGLKTIPLEDLSLHKGKGWAELQVSPDNSTETVTILESNRNSIAAWSGITGRSVVLVFRAAPDAGYVEVVWDGETQLINLASEVEKDLPITYNFSVPIYSSLIYLSSIFVVIASVVYLAYLFLAVEPLH